VLYPTFATFEQLPLFSRFCSVPWFHVIGPSLIYSRLSECWIDRTRWVTRMLLICVTEVESVVVPPVHPLALTTYFSTSDRVTTLMNSPSQSPEGARSGNLLSTLKTMVLSSACTIIGTTEQGASRNPHRHHMIIRFTALSRSERFMRGSLGIGQRLSRTFGYHQE